MERGAVTTNVAVAAEAIEEATRRGYRVSERTSRYARAALDAIDPRLAGLTPDDVTAIFDLFAEMAEAGDRKYLPSIPAHVWEVLSR
jgi:hypothetical protein